MWTVLKVTFIKAAFAQRQEPFCFAPLVDRKVCSVELLGVNVIFELFFSASQLVTQIPTSKMSSVAISKIA